MDTNVSVEAGLDDAVVEVPWTVADGDAGPGVAGYADLCGRPELAQALPEARAWPEVRVFLLGLHDAGSPVFTSKCDAWRLSEEERQTDFGSAAFGFGAYFDVVLKAGISLEAVLARSEAWADAARRLTPGEARVDFVVRPAVVHGTVGYAVTLYVFGYGETEEQARRCWQAALCSMTRVLWQDDTIKLAGE